MAGCRCPGRFPAATFAAAASHHGAQSARVAAPRSTSRTSHSSFSGVLTGAWSMRTAPGCAFQSAAVHGTGPEPVEYPAAWPCGRWLMLALMASQTVTVAIVIGLLTACLRFHGWPRIRQAGLMLVQPAGLAQQPVSRAHSGPNVKLTPSPAPPSRLTMGKRPAWCSGSIPKGTQALALAVLQAREWQGC